MKIDWGLQPAVPRQGRFSNWVSQVIDQLQQSGPESVTGDKEVVTQKESGYGILQLFYGLGRYDIAVAHTVRFVSVPAWLIAGFLVFPSI